MAVDSNFAYASMAEQDPSHPQQPRIHYIYGAFWEIGHGFSSTLIVRNKDRQHSVTATAILFAPDGKEEKRAPLEIMANSVGRLDLGSIVKAEGDSGKWGGLEVQINQPTPPFVMAQVVIENYHKGIIFDLPLHSGNSLDTNNAMHAPWLLSDKDTEGTVTLFNAGGQNITASPVLSADGSEQACEAVELTPHQTKRLNLRDLLRDCKPGDAAIGSITIRYSGRPHGLHAALLLSNMRTGFSLAPAFNARHAQQKNQQTSWRFPAVFALPDSSLDFRSQDTLTPYALLSNATEAPLTPRLEVFFDGPTPDEVKHAVLPITPLGPLETRREDLSKFIQSGLIPKDISHFSLCVTHNGAPGDLGVSVYSVNQTGDFVYNSEGGVGGSQAVDSSYWNIAGDLGSLLTVGNASDTKIQVQATVRYEASHGPASYSLPPIDLPGNGSRVINLKKAILSGIPDESGAVIPAGTTFGTLSLKVLGASTKSMILGGSTSFDPISGGYGQLYIPDCNDPGPWNGFVVYYIDGIELPPCWGINPNPCDFGSCGGGGGEPPFSLSIQGPTNVWWFNGETPFNYATTITLTCTASPTGTYDWSIVKGSSKATFSDGSTSITTGTNQVDINGVGMSTFHEVAVTVTTNGQTSSNYLISVRAPNRLVLTQNFVHTSDSTYGYSSYIHYRIEDQFTDVLPSDIAINEQWIDPATAVPDFTGTNWRQSVNMPGFVSPADWSDHIGGEAFLVPVNGNLVPALPTPSSPCTPFLCGLAVQHWGQEWRVGSDVIGSGRPVQTDIIQKYSDHAEVQSRVAPVPNTP